MARADWSTGSFIVNESERRSRIYIYAEDKQAELSMILFKIIKAAMFGAEHLCLDPINLRVRRVA